MIKLGEEQQEALDKMKAFINSNDEVFSLIGNAGTGKTTVLAEFLKSMPYLNYVMCAPTHKAALVLKKFTNGRKPYTIHSLLALSPNLDIFKLDMRTLQFKMMEENNGIPIKGLVICDESSMINDELFDLLTLKCKERGSKIIFCGDDKQLSPVNAISVSKVFNVENKFKLTKIYRQDNESALTPILAESRNEYIDSFSTDVRDKGSIYTFNEMLPFCEKYLDEITEAMKEKNILHTKLMCYTNQRVEQFNTAFHGKLFPNTEYGKGEIITCYDNMEFLHNKFYNSMDYIIMDKPQECEVTITPELVLPAYRIQLYDTLNECTNPIKILSRQCTTEQLANLAACIEEVRQKAIQCKNSKMRNICWSAYFGIVNKFATPVNLFYQKRCVRRKSFDYGYAITVHKSQGSTYEDTFIDMKNLQHCTEPLVKHQLQYVALSRCSRDCNILQ